MQWSVSSCDCAPCSAASGQAESLAATRPPLACPKIVPIRESYVSFEPGDGLVLFTDGVTETGPSPEQFFDVAGVEATARALWSRGASEIGHGLLAEASRHAGETLLDEATVVVVKFT